MGFIFNIYPYMEEKKSVCKNPWCKSTFIYTIEEAPHQCWKCQSYNDELSAGVTWTEKTYEGSRFDGQAHPISINIQKSGEQKRLW